MKRLRTLALLLCLLRVPTHGQHFLELGYATDSSVRRRQEPLTATSTDKALECVGSRHRPGRCEHLNKCFRDEYRSNFTLAMKHACTIDEAYVGVCCETREYLVEKEDLANVLPIIAVDLGKAKDTAIGANASRIVWSDGSSSNGSSSNGSSSNGSSSNGTPPRAEEKPKKPRGCGTSSNGGIRLVGGEAADPGEWPWMAALLRNGQSQFCGGVLVTDRHVLTAAHCVDRYQRPDIKIRLGEYDLDTPEESRARDFAVSEIRIHPDFDPVTYDNDIAIVKMHRPTAFDSYVWPVCLPPIDQTFENKSAIVTGWGTQYYGGPASTVLMEVQVPIWPQDKCVQSFVQRIPETMMCAGAYEGGRDACQGDSGGPLLLRLENGRWVNVGIVSWGIHCGEPGRPGIYTRVSSYLDWIFANAVF